LAYWPRSAEVFAGPRRLAGRRGGEERQEPRRILVNMPIEDCRQDDGVAEAADRKQLGQPLDNGENHGLQEGHVLPRDHLVWRSIRDPILRPGQKVDKDRRRSPPSPADNRAPRRWRRLLGGKPSKRGVPPAVGNRCRHTGRSERNTFPRWPSPRNSAILTMSFGGREELHDPRRARLRSDLRHLRPRPR